MNIHKEFLRCFIFFLAAMKFCEAFAVPQCPTEKYMTRGIIQKNNISNLIELGLFAPHQSHHRYSENSQQYTAQKASRFVRIISRKVTIIRSFISFRFSSTFRKNKKRYLSILASGIIAAGSLPHKASAQSSTNPTPMTKMVATSTRTTMDSEMKKSMAKISFLQYDTKAPNNYFEDFHTHDNVIFDTNLQTISEKEYILEAIDGESIDGNDHEYEFETTIDGCSSALPIVENTAQITTTENNQQSEDDLLVLNDRMVKNGVRNIAVASSGAAAVLLLSKKATRLNLKDNNGVHADIHKFEEIVPTRIEKNTELLANCETDNDILVPLLDSRYVEAMKQPKSPEEEVKLAARYAAIPTVEERAYQILVDLEMIEVRQ